MIPLGQPLLGRGWVLGQVERGPKSRDLGEGDKLNQSLVNKHVVQIDEWRQPVQPIIDEAKNGIWGVCV